jgi:hypothetical protein
VTDSARACRSPTDKTDKTSPALSATSSVVRPDKADETSRLLATGDPRIDVEPHGGSTTVGSDDRLCPNPPELPEALQRLYHDPRLREPRPVVAIDLAGRKRAC